MKKNAVIRHDIFTNVQYNKIISLHTTTCMKVDGQSAASPIERHLSYRRGSGSTLKAQWLPSKVWICRFEPPIFWLEVQSSTH